MIDKSELVIAPDSSMVHIAGALKKPVIGLYSSFKSNLRMKWYRYAHAFESEYQCAPCFIHGHGACPEGRKKMMMMTDKEKVIKGFNHSSPCFECIGREDNIQLITKKAIEILNNDCKHCKKDEDLQIIPIS